MRTTLALLLACGMALSAGAADLRVTIVPRFNNAPLVFDSPVNMTAAGQLVSVTRLDFLLSDFALRRADGAWIERTNWFAFIRARERRTAFAVNEVPAAQYDRVRFHVGLDPAVNHGDAAQYPAKHPLNPEVNGLHWGWTGGYVFLALEGGWPNNGQMGGFSWHLATDRELMTVELPATLNLNANGYLEIALNVDRMFAARNLVRLSDQTATTHSRTNDPFADRLRENAESAFSTISAQQDTFVQHQPGVTATNFAAATATPYRLTISKFFPRPDLPRDNPLTGEGVVLGSKLFFDPRLSANNRESCAACHHPRQAFAEGRRVSRGVGGAIGTRNAPPLLNLAWKNSFFWDGRAPTLRQQVLQPIQNPVEMHSSLPEVVAKLERDNSYPKQFAAAFGTPEISAGRIALALEQFLLAQVSFDSKFDRVLAGQAKLTDQEQRGFELFNTEYDPGHGQNGADCFHCHSGPLFTDHRFHNTGLDAEPRDQGRFIVTKNQADVGKFATPSLRNVELTAPYMHDGRFATLEQVVEHYSSGAQRSAALDPNLAKHPDTGLQLSAADQQALVAFLKTLTDESLRQQPPPPPQVAAIR